MKKTRQLLLTLCCALPLIVNAQNYLKLSEMDLSKVYQSYGNTQKNKAVTGEKLQIAGVNYLNGIGVHSDCRIKINLQRNSSFFTCKIGLNDRHLNYKDPQIQQIPMTDGTMVFYQKTPDGGKQFIGVGKGDGTLSKGSAVFTIVGDGKELFNSGVMHVGDAVQTVKVPIKGVEVLELNVSGTDDGISGDHADWIDATFNYFEIPPVMVTPDYMGEVQRMSSKVQQALTRKIGKLKEISLQMQTLTKDWLIDSKDYKAGVYQTQGGKDIVLSNGLVSRVFRIFPNLATIDLQNRMLQQNILRAVSNEGTVTIDGRLYQLGGLDGQEEYGYTQYEWIDKMKPFANSFRVIDFKVSDIQPHINWKPSRWSLVKEWDAHGKELTFTLQGPGFLKDVFVKIHYELYHGVPCLGKWIEVINNSSMPINLDQFKLEQLAMAEPESSGVKTIDQFIKPNIHVESDWGFGSMIERGADFTEYWEKDPRFTSQCDYSMRTPCLLEVKLPMGPDEKIGPGTAFKSFRNYIMPFDSESRERKGLFRKRLYKKIAPWTTENPIFLHCVSSDPKVVKNAVDQCAEAGYEMVILSFGCGLNMEDEREENYNKYKTLVDYAHSKGIEMGGYSLLSSRWISDDVDVINPKTGKRGGMIFGSSPCLCSEWGYNYFRKIKKFYRKTGMDMFENDGSYPGNVCASTKHAHHRGLKDSQWKQRLQIDSLYKWMNERDIYMNIPDYGYLLGGSNKVGIGYREVNWSLPRERQLILGRQVNYDGLWERLPGMCWTFVPLTQYHGGGAAATIEPLNEHLDTYKAHMIQNYGSGIQACYRGPRLYDTDKTKEMVKEVISWYKKYRAILNSDVLHLRRADGKDWDGILHVAPDLKEKGLAMLYNPTNKTMKRTITLPLYYTGLTQKAHIRVEEGATKEYQLSRDYKVTLTVSIPANGSTWLVIE